MKKINLLLLFLISISATAQLPFVPYTEISLTDDGAQLENPWAGGFNSPQFSTIDLNGDGIKDLVSFERGDYGAFRTFINNSSPNAVDYSYAPEYESLFPQLQHWALLVDYNCDGYEDLFTSVASGIKVYRNDFSETAGNRFVLENPILQAEGLNGQEALFVISIDLPAITDVDGDGDVDILSFDVSGNRVAYFKNMSLEKYGDCNALEFELKNTCWGYFSEDASNNTIVLNDTCEENVVDPEKTEKHAGSTLLALDANGDGVTDLALGDLAYNTLTFLTNGGTPTSSGMTSVSYNFPQNSTPVNLPVFPAIYLLDVDNDAKKDLLASPSNPNTSDNFNNIWYYKNTGTEAVPEFTFEQNNFLQETMLDMGEGAFASFFDENADGLMDIVVGNYGYYEGTADYSSQLALLRNTGTADEPVFELISTDYDDLAAFGLNGIYPSFGDMDGDGDEDMVTGDEDGLLHYFRNDGGAGNPADFTLSQANFMGIDVGQSAKPQIVDVNRDGLPDLIVGRREGRIFYYQNNGTLEIPSFNALPTHDFFGGVDVLPACCTGFSAPHMVEDSVGNYMLYVGSESGMLYLYNNIEDNLNGSFNPVDSLYLHAMHVNVSAFDINNDESPELVVGKYAGGIGFLKSGDPQVYGIRNYASSRPRITLFPNPADDFIRFSIEPARSESTLSIEVIDLYGNSLISNVRLNTGKSQRLSVSGLSSGIYFLKIGYASSVSIERFVVK